MFAIIAISVIRFMTLKDILVFFFKKSIQRYAELPSNNYLK